MATIDLDIESRQMGERIIVVPPISHQPPRKLLDRPQVMVAGLYAQSAAAEVGQELPDATGGNIADDVPFAPAHDLAHLRGKFANVLLGIALVMQMLRG
jgi:hypothetical protein